MYRPCGVVSRCEVAIARGVEKAHLLSAIGHRGDVSGDLAQVGVVLLEALLCAQQLARLEWRSEVMRVLTHLPDELLGAGAHLIGRVVELGGHALCLVCQCHAGLYWGVKSVFVGDWWRERGAGARGFMEKRVGERRDCRGVRRRVTRGRWWGDSREKEARYHELGEQNESEKGYG